MTEKNVSDFLNNPKEWFEIYERGLIMRSLLKNPVYPFLCLLSTEDGFNIHGAMIPIGVAVTHPDFDKTIIKSVLTGVKKRGLKVIASMFFSNIKVIEKDLSYESKEIETNGCYMLEESRGLLRRKLVIFNDTGEYRSIKEIKVDDEISTFNESLIKKIHQF